MAFEGRIPEQVLEDILSRIDIVEVISAHFPLKRAGRNFKANCPFHQEKTPSFMVSADKQIYHCFGCGESGNAFKFLMRYERLEFLEAVETLAKKAGVVLPQRSSSGQAQEGIRSQVLAANALAVEYYEKMLRDPAAAEARRYLQKRGLTETAAKRCRMGFAPSRWDGLIEALRQQKVSLDLMERAGLVLPKERGGYYDRFRNRIIFPIFDVKDRPVGFGARALGEEQPKYLNSPETPLYTKGNHLYGLHLSKDAIRQQDTAVIVEGYLDFLTPFCAGVENIAASLGTALTAEQARLLKRFARTVVVLYDADDAGQMASVRSLDVLIEEDLQVSVVSLPSGHDPDSFVRGHGAAELKARIARALSFFDFKLAFLRKKFDARTVEGRSGIASEMIGSINKFKSPIVRSEYLRKLAGVLDLREDALMQEAARGKAVSGKVTGQTIKRPASSPMHPSERLLVKMMIEEAEFISRIREVLEPADFLDERLARMVALIYELSQQGQEVHPRRLMQQVEDEETVRFICESAFPVEDSFEKKQKIVDGCIQQLQKRRLQERRLRLHEQIQQAQQSGDAERLRRLAEEFNALIKKG